MFVFALIVSVLFNYTLDLKSTQVNDVGAGLLWLIFAFAGVLGLNRVFVSESEGATLSGLLVAPIERAAVFLGKWLSTAIFIAVTQLINVPVFALFANLPFANLPALLPVLLLGSIGFAAVGTLFAAIAGNTRMREVMLLSCCCRWRLRRSWPRLNLPRRRWPAGATIRFGTGCCCSLRTTCSL